MVVTVHNDGDCGIRAMIHCANVTGTKSPIEYGASVVSGQTSTANCLDNDVLFGSSGWQW